MFKKLLIGATLILSSSLAQASLIEYNGYSRDISSNIVTGGGLEWLMWDETKGMSINEALTAYAGEGWKLATGFEMAMLFNAFKFGKNDWLPAETISQGLFMPPNPDENSSHNRFISIFGITSFSSCHAWQATSCFSTNDPYIQSLAFFGSNYNSQGYNLANVLDDYTYIDSDATLTYGSHLAALNSSSTNFTEDYKFQTYGIALIRSDSSYVPIPVPTPSSLSLFVLALAGFIYKQRGTITQL